MTELRRLGRRSNKIAYTEDSDSDSAEELTHPEHVESSDEEVDPVPTKRKKPASVRSKTPKTTKRRKPLTNKALDTLEEQLDENYLYQLLSQPNLDVLDLALEWIDSYTDDQASGINDSMTVLINLILRCCGSVFLFQPHDLLNLESCAETVAELCIAFGGQKAHKYPFRALPVFRKNVVAFFDEIINVAHENGLLYKYEKSTEDSLASPLMLHILTWISSLSSCTIRPLRFVSTVVLLSIQNQLCKIITSVITNLDKSQQQLKKFAKSKAKKDAVERTVKSYQAQQKTITEYFGEISNVTLAHRYRDIDPLIRQECLSYLSQAMLLYKDYFFQATFLRYFGWLLLDPLDTVRSEVSKILVKLYKQKNLTLGFRQFTERYKDLIVKMCKLDSNVHVRLNSISVCCELLRVGFLSDTESVKIVSVLLHLVVPLNISKGNFAKIRIEVSRFISILVEKKFQEVLTKEAMFLETYKPNKDLDLNLLLRVKCLIQVLHLSAESLLLVQPELAGSLDKVFSDIYETLYMATFVNTLELLVCYLLLDVESIEFAKTDVGESIDDDSDANTPEVTSFKALLDLNVKDKLYILNFVNGSLRSIFSKATHSDQIAALIDFLPAIHSLLSKHNLLTHEFLNIWNLLLSNTKSLLLSFTELNQVEAYNEINIGLLKYYQYADVDDSFDFFFSKLLQDFSTAGGPLITPEIKLQVQDLLQEFVGECKDVLKETDVTSSSELQVQNKLLVDVVECAKPVLRLNKLGEFIDLSPVGSKLLEYLTKLVQNLDLSLIAKEWLHNFLEVVDSVVTGYKVILDFVLVVYSWKIEHLIYTENQQRFDVIRSFSELEPMSKALLSLLKSIDSTIAQVYSEETPIKSQLIIKLTELQTMSWAKFADLTTSFKIFYVKFKNNNLFRNFNMYFNQGFGLFVSNAYPFELQHQLLRLFLYKEVRLAKLLNVELERNDEEDVNIEELAVDEIPEEAPPRSMFDEEEEHELEQFKPKGSDKAWMVEKDLCVFAIKLFSLLDLALVDEFVLERIRLNREVIGGVYLKIVKQNEEKNKVPEVAATGKSHGHRASASKKEVHTEADFSRVVESPDEHSNVVDTEMIESAIENDEPGVEGGLIIEG